MIGIICIYCFIFLIIILWNLFVQCRAACWLCLAKRRYKQQRKYVQLNLAVTRKERRIKMHAKRTKIDTLTVLESSSESEPDTLRSINPSGSEESDENSSIVNNSSTILLLTNHDACLSEDTPEALPPVDEKSMENDELLISDDEIDDEIGRFEPDANLDMTKLHDDDTAHEDEDIGYQQAETQEIRSAFKIIDSYLKTGNIENLLNDSPPTQMDDQQQPSDIGEPQKSVEEMEQDINSFLGSLVDKAKKSKAPIPVPSR